MLKLYQEPLVHLLLVSIVYIILMQHNYYKVILIAPILSFNLFSISNSFTYMYPIFLLIYPLNNQIFTKLFLILFSSNNTRTKTVLPTRSPIKASLIFIKAKKAQKTFIIEVIWIILRSNSNIY